MHAGIIAVNVATFIGRKEAGIIGGIAATLGQVFPCLVIICVIAGLLTNFSDLEIVQDAFNGVRACVCVLILNAVLKLFKTDVVDIATFLIFLAVLAGAALYQSVPGAVRRGSRRARRCAPRAPSGRRFPKGGGRKMIYLRLFLEFFRTGLFAVGGGLATMPFLYHISDTTGWFSMQIWPI